MTSTTIDLVHVDEQDEIRPEEKTITIEMLVKNVHERLENSFSLHDFHIDI
jgi:hypothetical protein